MSASENTFPGESLANRLAPRMERRPQVGARAAFYARFGLGDPWSDASEAGGGAVAPAGYSYLSSAAFYGQMSRWEARASRWEERAGRVGQHRMPAAARAWADGSVARALRASLPDFVLPKAFAEAAAVAEPVSGAAAPRAAKKAYEPMRPVESPWLSFDSRPARVVRGGKVQEAAPLRAPRLDPRAPGAPRAARRARSLERVRSLAAETAPQPSAPQWAALPDAPVLAGPVRRGSAARAATVGRAGNAPEAAVGLSRRERRASLRAAVRSVGLVERLVAAPAVEAYTDDQVATPVARASGRSTARGARTAAQRSAVVQAAESAAQGREVASVVGARPAVGLAARVQAAFAPEVAGRAVAPAAARVARSAADGVVVSTPVASAGAPAAAEATVAAGRSSGGGSPARAAAPRVASAPASARRWARSVVQAASRGQEDAASRGSLLPRVARWSAPAEAVGPVAAARTAGGGRAVAAEGRGADAGRPATAAQRALARSVEPRLALAPAPVAAVLAAAQAGLSTEAPSGPAAGASGAAVLREAAPARERAGRSAAQLPAATAEAGPVRASAALRAAAEASVGPAPVGSPEAPAPTGAAARAVARLDLTAPPAARPSSRGAAAPAAILPSPGPAASTAAGSDVGVPPGGQAPAAVRPAAAAPALPSSRASVSGRPAASSSSSSSPRAAASVVPRAERVAATGVDAAEASAEARELGRSPAAPSRPARPAERLAARAQESAAAPKASATLSASPLSVSAVTAAPAAAPARATVRAAARLLSEDGAQALVPARSRVVAPEALLPRAAGAASAVDSATPGPSAASAPPASAPSRASVGRRTARSVAPSVRAAARVGRSASLSETARRVEALGDAPRAAVEGFVRRASPLAHVRIAADGAPSLTVSAAEAEALGLSPARAAGGALSLGLAEATRVARALGGIRRAAVAADGVLPAAPSPEVVETPAAELPASRASRGSAETPAPRGAAARAARRPSGRPMDWMLVRTAASVEPAAPVSAPASAPVDSTATVDGVSVPVARAGRSVVRTADGRFLPRSAARPGARGPALPAADDFVVPSAIGAAGSGASAAGSAPVNDGPAAASGIRPAPASRTARPSRVRGFARPQADLGYTLDAVERGRDDHHLPVWARRSVGEPLVRGTGGDVLTALAKAQAPEDVVRVIVERGGALGTAASALPAPVLQVIEAIRSEARSELGDAQKSAVSDAAAAARAAAAQSPTPRSTARVVRGFTSLRSAPSARRNDGVGADGVMRLARRLQDLIHLAEGRGDRDAARKQVRMAEDSSAARAEGQGLSAGASAGRDPQVDVDALAREVFDVVTRELELRRERRQEDPDERSGWF